MHWSMNSNSTFDYICTNNTNFISMFRFIPYPNGEDTGWIFRGEWSKRWSIASTKRWSWVSYSPNFSASFFENCDICFLFSSSLMPRMRDDGPPSFHSSCLNGVYELGFRRYTFKPCFLSSRSLNIFGRNKLSTYEALVQIGIDM